MGKMNILMIDYNLYHRFKNFQFFKIIHSWFIIPKYSFIKINGYRVYVLERQTDILLKIVIWHFS